MRKLIFFLLFNLFSGLLFAQRTVTVKVVDVSTGNSISNASVKVRSSGKGAITDASGACKLQAGDKDVIEISSVGYASQELPVNGRTDISVFLQSSAVMLGDIVMIGTRGAPRAKTETAVPVDVIRINQAGLSSAKMDLTSQLNMAAPSFNYNKQSGADGADHIDQGTLRGLGPDQTLVLINGKRRHTTAFVTLFGTRGRGNSGTDLNAFPENAVDRIEILRDGASAQYGSDAIAGVMNIILKKDVNHWNISTGWAGNYDNKFNADKFNGGNQYYSGSKIDGQTFTFAANNGVKIGNNGGFVNLSFNYLTQGKTFREVDTTNGLTDKNALPGIGFRRAFGDGSVDTYGGMYNLEAPTNASKNLTIYSFGGINYKSSDAFAYSRNWNSGGHPERFPVDMNGNLKFDANIMHVTDDGTIYYNPHIQTHITDVSFAFGVKGKCHNWNWDLSNTVGRNDFHFYGDRTFNASQLLTANTMRQTHFNDGGFNFLQNTINLDLSKSFKSIAEGLNLGLGAEYRLEQYNIYAGEEASYKGYYTTDLYYPVTNDNRTPSAGSQGFPGFSPNDAIKADRNNIGLYADAELNATNAWLIDGAARYEHYSDFGSVLTFKLASRYKITPDFNLRGSFSTGFRAPSLQQINFSNKLTSFSGGVLFNQLFARNTASITRAAGIPDLKQETSVNGSLGFSWKPMPGLTFTLDGYMVKMKDRIVESGLFYASDNTLPAAFLSQIPSDVASVQFFANAVNTTNYGVDIVADYSHKCGIGTFKALLAGNIQHMTIDEIHVPSGLNNSVLHQKTFYSDREQAFLTASAPPAKFSLSLEYDFKKFGVGTHLNYLGRIKLMGFGSSTADNPFGGGINPQVPSDNDPNVLVPEVFDFKGKFVTDIFGSYRPCKKMTLFIGADNVFNVHPNLGVNPQAKYWYGDNESGGPWDSVQMGFNGMRLFGKLVFDFK